MDRFEPLLTVCLETKNQGWGGIGTPDQTPTIGKLHPHSIHLRHGSVGEVRSGGQSFQQCLGFSIAARCDQFRRGRALAPSPLESLPGLGQLVAVVELESSDIAVDRIVRRGSQNGLDFVGSVHLAPQAYAVLKRLQIRNSSKEKKTF